MRSLKYGTDRGLGTRYSWPENLELLSNGESLLGMCEEATRGYSDSFSRGLKDGEIERNLLAATVAQLALGVYSVEEILTGIKRSRSEAGRDALLYDLGEFESFLRSQESELTHCLFSVIRELCSWSVRMGAVDESPFWEEAHHRVRRALPEQDRVTRLETEALGFLSRYRFSSLRPVSFSN